MPESRGGGSGDLRVTGVQLRIYIYMLESGRPVGVRELARDLGLPASTVHYSLRRLEELGLVASTPDGYRVASRLPLEGFLYVRRRLVPRLAIYSLFFAGAALGSAALIVVEGVNQDRLALLLVSVAAALATLFEGLNARRRLLSEGL